MASGFGLSENLVVLDEQICVEIQNFGEKTL